MHQDADGQCSAVCDLGVRERAPLASLRVNSPPDQQLAEQQLASKHRRQTRKRLRLDEEDGSSEDSASSIAREGAAATPLREGRASMEEARELRTEMLRVREETDEELDAKDRMLERLATENAKLCQRNRALQQALREATRQHAETASTVLELGLMYWAAQLEVGDAAPVA